MGGIPLAVTPNGVAVTGGLLIFVRPFLGVVILFVVIARMHIKNIRGGQDGMGGGVGGLGGVSVSELCVGRLGGEQMCGRGCCC